MIRCLRTSKKLLAAMLIAMLTSAAPLAEAQAGQACVWNGGYCGTGKAANVYSITVYYAHQGQWHQYGRYFATQYANGAIDWGGADYAAQQIQANGLAYTYTW
jgi:hypothetical protein